MMKQIVFLATHWGTKYGGINAFNFDLCRAVAQVIPQDTYQIVCVVWQADEKATIEAKQAGIEVLSLNLEQEEFDPTYAHQTQALLLEKSFNQITWWIGHDVISGEIAFKLRELHAPYPGKVALIHHMDYGAYKIFQTRQDTRTVQRKIDLQRRLFQQADAVFAVGPYLQQSAQDLYGKPVSVLTPGLIEDFEEAEMPSLFNVITLGRLEPENDMVKQLTISVKALGKAYEQYKRLSDIAERPKMWVYGISEDDNASQKLLTIAEEAAHARIPINAFPYQENRQELWAHMRGCSVCLMPSLHEGFGLVGWEAIGLEVPLIISKDTGLFRLLHDLYATDYVQKVDITGIEEQDIEPLAQCIMKVYFDKLGSKKRAIALKQFLLDKGYTWENTAHDFLTALEIKSQRIDDKQQESLNYPRPASFLLPTLEFDATTSYLTSKLSEGTVQELMRKREAWQESRKNEAITWIREIRGDKTGWQLLAPEVKAQIVCFEASLELSTTGNIERAKTLVDEAQGEYPTDNAARILARIAALNETDLEKAMGYLAGHEDVDSLNLKAELLLAFGKIDECRQIMERKSIHHETNADTFRIRAFLYLVEKKVYQAQREIQKAIQLKPRWERIRFAKGIIYYFSALSPAVLPGLLPDRFVNWPEPVDRIFVKHDDESVELFRKAAAIFLELLQQAQQEGQAVEVLRTWYVACLANDIERQEEAATYCRQTLREEPTEYHLILWGLARDFTLDVGLSITTLERLVQENSAHRFHILALARCYIEAQTPQKAVTLLEETKAVFQEKRAEMLWTSWYVRSLAVSGNFDAVAETMNTSELQADLKHGQALALQIRAQETGDWQPFFQHLEDSFKETNDPAFLLEMWHLKAQQQDWEYLAERAEQFVKDLSTSEALKLAVFAAQNAGQFELCLRLLDGHRELFNGQTLPAELRRMRVTCLHILGLIPEAIAETEALTRDETTTEHLLGLANLYVVNGDRESLIIVVRQLSQKPDLTSKQALKLASYVNDKDRRLAERLWRKALESGVSDEQVAHAVVLGHQLGLERDMAPLHRRMWQLGQRGKGGIQAVSIENLISAVPQWREHDRRVAEWYQNGTIATHLLAERYHRPLVDFYHRFLYENEQDPDPLHQTTLFARHGGHPLMLGLPEEPPKWRLHLDNTALLLAAHLEILDDVESVFRTLHIPQQLIPALQNMREQLVRGQPARLQRLQQIVEFADLGALNLVEHHDLPTDYPNRQLIDELGEEWVALFERANAGSGYLVVSLPLKKIDLSGPPIALPEEAERTLISCWGIVESLRKNGSFSEENYAKALESLRPDEQDSSGETIPQQESSLLNVGSPNVFSMRTCSLRFAGVLPLISERAKSKGCGMSYKKIHKNAQLPHGWMS